MEAYLSGRDGGKMAGSRKEVVSYEKIKHLIF